MDFEAERARMVRNQLLRRGIGDQRVLAAMGEVHREEFVDPRDRRRAYRDGALPIGYGQTISQPWVVASICQALATRPGDRALEIGTGSGYSTAVMARLCGSVTSFEIVPELCGAAAERLAGIGNVEVICGDGLADLPEGPFDVIAVHAATPGLPVGLLERLEPAGGRLVAPVRRAGEEMLTLFRRDHGETSEEPIAAVRFVPLTGRLGA